MPLVKSALEQMILAAFEKQAGKTDEKDDPKKSREELAADLASAIDTFIKSGTVNTTITGVDGTGSPVTGTGVGSVS